MKLNSVPSATGLQWVKQGARTFFKQPLALASLCFMLIAGSQLLAIIPLIGSLAALALLPAGTLGLMAAAAQAEQGVFPLPSTLITAFRSGAQKGRNMLILGGLYAAGFFLVVLITTAIDGGKLAQAYFLGGELSKETLTNPDFQLAAMTFSALYLPLSFAFWHAPALVHWHDVSPVKSLFFSFMACRSNFWAMVVFGLSWVGMLMGSLVGIAVLADLLGSKALANFVVLPVVLMALTILFSSFYFTYRDSFTVEAPPAV